MTCTTFGAPKPAALRRLLEERKSFNTEDTKATEEFIQSPSTRFICRRHQARDWRIRATYTGGARP